MDFPVIEEPPAVAAIDTPAAAPAPRTEVATAAAQAIDLAKVDLDAVVRAQFGPWRETAAKLTTENAKTVLDLSTQSKVNEAKSLRERTINTPVAEARKTCKALKSMLAGASAKAGEEVDALVLGYTEAAEPITKQIDAAQARIDAEKAEKARIEREAQERHTARLQVIAGYLARCQEPGMTAERIQKGIDLLSASDVSDEDAARADALIGAKARALESMRLLRDQAAAREAEAARQEAIRLENERVAAELAAERARIAAEAEAIRRQSAELAAREAAQRAEVMTDQETPAPVKEFLTPEATRAVLPCVVIEPVLTLQPHFEPEPTDTLQALAAEARGSRFPSQPKMSAAVAGPVERGVGPGAEARPLVERLRLQWSDTPHHRDALHREAADEIERLHQLLKNPTRGLVFAGWFSELRSGMSYRLWEQGGHDPEPNDVPLYV